MILEKSFSIILTGGFKVPYLPRNYTSFEVKSGNSRTTKLDDLPRQSPLYSSFCKMVLHNGHMFLINGSYCFVFDHGTWKQHSKFTYMRDFVAVSAEIGIFLFKYDGSYVYLLNDQTTWKTGKNKIRGGFSEGSTIFVQSKQEIWLIGGEGHGHRILSFNINDFTFKKLRLQLKLGRFGHRCAMIPNTNKIMISGGHTYNKGVSITSTEILDPETMSISISSPMNIGRAEHGISVITFNDENRLAVFGGYDGSTELGSFELYNTKTQKWELTQELSLEQEKRAFGYLSVKSDLIYKYLN